MFTSQKLSENTRVGRKTPNIQTSTVSLKPQVPWNVVFRQAKLTEKCTWLFTVKDSFRLLNL